MGSKVIVSTASLRSTYQSLLLGEWTETSFQKVLAVLWDATGSQSSETPDWWNALDPNRVNSGQGVNPRVVERIRMLAETLTAPAIPPVPPVIQDSSGSQSALHAETAWTYLILQSLDHLEGDVGFFEDAQSLLFLSCLAYLLPKLEQESLVAHRDCLLNAMYSHTFLVWRDRPSHMYYLQSALMDYLNDFGSHLQLLSQSIRLTPVTDHSYLTKVQGYWSDLIDVTEYDRAENFLLDIYRSALRDDFKELQEMFQPTRKAMVGAYDA
jgi:hypothetical protein